ncbi:hypothetical protein GJAV_G00032970 [Gymnothorax javanicus]|nr:hypothetical protein GJAV_G00032970 [Gymnothorax javanicus]
MREPFGELTRNDPSTTSIKIRCLRNSPLLFSSLTTTERRGSRCGGMLGLMGPASCSEADAKTLYAGFALD